MKFVSMVLAGLALLAGPAGLESAHAAAPRKKPAVKARPAAQPVPARAPAAPAVVAALRQQASGSVGNFYAGRGFRPLWVESLRIGPAAHVFVRQLDDARLDGLKPSRYRPERLKEAIGRTSGGDPAALASAEIALSKAFARYVNDLRKVRKVGMIYADRDLRPAKASPERVLRVAANARSFDDYVRSMGWMSPLYVETRGLLGNALDQRLDDHVVDTIRLNLERARHLPPPSVRHIVVDAASARLWYYQDGQEVGTMKVVVGAKATQTPMMAGSINYAIVNPYWNIPDYLVRDNVAKKILSGRTLASMHMEALSDWSANPARLDPASVDWPGIAANRSMVRVRELPGPHNSMGKVKFVFPNDEGIYLHDTPNRDLFAKDDRHLSNGCIRLEHAETLGKWMMGPGLKAQLRSSPPEHAIPLTATVPVYLTYLTVMPGKAGVAIRPDVYGHDRGS